MSVRLFVLLGSALLAILLILLAPLYRGLGQVSQIDLTQAGLYTVSEPTRRVLEELNEPLQLEFVYSASVGADYPAIRSHAARIEALLQTYERLSGGKIAVRVTNPAPFSRAEDDALLAGLAAVPTDGPDPLYFGLIGRNTVDEIRVIDFFRPEAEADLEYDLTQLIISLKGQEAPVLGLLSTLPGFTGTGEGVADTAIFRDLATLYTIDRIPPGFSRLPDDLDALVLIHPPELSPAQTYLIDQYVARGGAALIVVDPLARAQGGMMDLAFEQSSRLDDILEGAGLRLPDRVLADLDSGLPVSLVDETGRVQVEAQPLFPGLEPDAFNPEDRATADLSRSVNLGASGWFEIIEGRTVRPLVSATGDLASLPIKIASEGPLPERVRQAADPFEGPAPVVVRAGDRYRSAFPNGRGISIPDDDPVMTRIIEEARAGHINRSDAPARLVAIADSDLLADGFYINPQSGVPVADNGVLVLNLIGDLVGEVDISALRARAPRARTMTRVEALRDNAQARLSAEQDRIEADIRASEASLATLSAPGLEDDPAREAEVLRIRDRLIAQRERLRVIEREFRTDIDTLEQRLRFLNIWAAPLLVGLFGLGVFLYRRRFERRG